MKKYNVAIVGATGLVGSTFLKVLEEEKFPINNLRLFASSKSAGKKIIYDGKEYIVEELNKDSFENIDIALFSAGGKVSLEYCPIAAAKGAIVIDNSSTFRNYPDLPLVVPEVNPEDIRNHGIISNPNCSTIQSIVPLKALEEYGIKRVNYTTYQAVSGSGMKGIKDLENTLEGKKNEFYPYPISQTCIPEIDSWLENGYTKEEMKMVNETRKMLHMPNLPVSATCVRVPVRNSHGVSIQVELEKEFSIEDVRKKIASYPGLILVDDLKNHKYPVSILSTGNNLIYVGRIRKDLSTENGLLLYCVADNVRKGAAANAVQIAQYIVKNKMI